MALKPRGRALRWLTKHRGITEQPYGSNCDERKDGIRAAQLRCANGGAWLLHQPWCGVWAWNALHHAGVQDLTSRLASVALIEDDATAGRGCFVRWTTDVRKARRGDLVVLFGRGVHVETIRSTWQARFGYIRTEGGNTSPEGGSGSQANGGGSYPRRRPLSAIHGIAIVNYPEK